MNNLIIKLHQVLNLLKDFNAGYSSENQSAMLVKYKDKVYKVEIKELGEGEVNNYFKNL